jgi:predicted tellurium resistance membrane protein TerC
MTLQEEGPAQSPRTGAIPPPSTYNTRKRDIMELLLSPEAWMALVTLTLLEIILGVDNIIFIAILAGRLPPHQQAKGRTIGLFMAMFMRIALLFSITLVMRLTEPLFEILGREISGSDLILIAGGLFLIFKSTVEIHANLEGDEERRIREATRKATFFGVITQIMIFDIVFSLDSVITAIGLADHLPVMVTAIMIAVGFMIFLAGTVSRFVEEHPTFKILALSFLLLIGTALVAEGLDLHIPKGYIYFAMAFSVFVELLNMKIRKRAARPVRLRVSSSGAMDGPQV